MRLREEIQKLSDNFSSLTHDVVQQVSSPPQISKYTPSLVYNHMKGSILELMAKNMSVVDQEFLLTRWAAGFTHAKAAEPKKEDDSHDDVLKPQLEGEEDVILPADNDTDTLHTASCPSPILSTTEPGGPVPKVATKEVEYHPIFGQLLADIGYKQVYLTSARRLVLAQVWQKQRTLRPERSAGIAKVTYYFILQYFLLYCIKIIVDLFTDL
jgi:hypothetical protein